MIKGLQIGPVAVHASVAQALSGCPAWRTAPVVGGGSSGTV